MNLKNIYLLLLISGFLSLASPVIAEPVSKGTNKPTKEVPAAVQPLLNRLQEIKDMDKSTLSKSERKALRDEVKEIKAEVRTNKNGIYLSVGAIIIVLLLLILIL